ncbi:magnesium transporter [Saccharospirillum sp. MSK14-1]|uniref:magnesium transporter n=1 Tax=Saccharospirillum sp. MSK14-1 TaxID=1897632 RepID=UPI000D35E8A4|nr:magnesium transporter [Saccharospirillum sp. MSK14-1]
MSSREETLHDHVEFWLEELAAERPPRPDWFDGLSDTDIAFTLESLPFEARLSVWQAVPPAMRGAVLVELHDEHRRSLLKAAPPDSLLQWLGRTDPEDLLELMDDLPVQLGRRVLRRLDQEEREQLQAALGYDDDQIGRWLSFKVITVVADTPGRLFRKALRETGIPEMTDVIVLVDDNGRYQGCLSLDTAMQVPTQQPLSQFIDPEINPLNPALSLHEGAQSIRASGWSMLPVVDENGTVLGRFTASDALDVITEEQERQISQLTGGGLEEEDLFSPVRLAVPKRSVWLGINLLTALLAAWVIGRFEVALSQWVALAVLMPVVASMGGIAGSQTLSLAIRGLATGQLGSANVRSLIRKELLVGAINAVLWAVVIGIVASVWYDSLVLMGVIAFAILVNLVAASLAGVAVPWVLSRMKIDPALAGSVVLTTVTDVVGFFAFLGTASLVLAFIG